MPVLGIVASSISGNLGAYESIRTITVGSGGSANIVFDNIPSNYLNLQVRALSVSAATYVDMQINGDTGSNYTFHQVETSGTGTVTSNGASGMTQIYASQLTANISFPAIGIIDFLDYANTSKNKTVRLLSGTTGTAGGNMYFRSGVWLNNAAINTITFRAQGAVFGQNTKYALFGIKGA